MGTRQNYTSEFKIEAAGLVLDQGYSVSEACKSMGIGESAMRRWVKQLREERNGITPKGSCALTADQKRIQELELQVKKLSREKEILKKASALLMSDLY